MANYTLKELKEMSTERLIAELVQGSSSMTQSVRNKEEKIFKILEERNVISYDEMRKEYERISIW